MGLYIEPQNELLTKKDFMDVAVMDKKASVIDDINQSGLLPSNIANDKVIVCLVDNIFFYALAVAFNDRELEAFTLPGDERPKTFYLMDKDLARKHTPNFDSYLKQ